MSEFKHLETDTGTNVNISSPTAIGSYTATADKLVMCDVSIDAVAGNGDYIMFVKRKIGGAGSDYVIIPKTTLTAASGETAISGQSGWITVRNGDVLTVYVDGLATDTATPDYTTRWFELAGVGVAAIADGIADEATSGHTTAGTFGKAISDILGVTDTEIATIINHLIDIKGVGWTNETLVALKAYVDELETRLTAARAGYLDKLNVIGTLAHSNDANTYKADVSGLAKTTHLQEVEDKVDAIPVTPLLAANYTAPDNASILVIKDKTDQLTFTQPNKVDATAAIDPTGIATESHLQDVEDKLDVVKDKTDQLTFTQPNKVDASATVDPTGIATEEHLQEVEDKVDHIKSKTDLFDYSKVTVVPVVIGSTITILRGDTLIADLNDLGSLADYVSLDFSVKRLARDSDDDALVRIRKNASGFDDGLLRLNGAAHLDRSDGSITINDLVTGDITIRLKAGATDDLAPGSYVYDIQRIEADMVKTLTTGTLIVKADVTRLVE